MAAQALAVSAFPRKNEPSPTSFSSQGPSPSRRHENIAACSQNVTERRERSLSPSNPMASRRPAAVGRKWQRLDGSDVSSTSTGSSSMPSILSRSNSLASSTSSRGRSSRKSTLGLDDNERFAVAGLSSMPKTHVSGRGGPQDMIGLVGLSYGASSMAMSLGRDRGPILPSPSRSKVKSPKIPKSASPTSSSISPKQGKMKPFVNRFLSRGSPSSPSYPTTTTSSPLSPTAEEIPVSAASTNNSAGRRYSFSHSRSTSHPTLHITVGAAPTPAPPIPAPAPYQYPRPPPPPKSVDYYSPDTPSSSITMGSSMYSSDTGRAYDTPDTSPMVTPMSAGSYAQFASSSSPTASRPLPPITGAIKTPPARGSSLGMVSPLRTPSPGRTAMITSMGMGLQNGRPASPPPPSRSQTSLPTPPLPPHSADAYMGPPLPAKLPSRHIPTPSASLPSAASATAAVFPTMGMDEFLARPRPPFASNRSHSAPSSPVHEKPLPPLNGIPARTSQYVSTTLDSLAPAPAHVSAKSSKQGTRTALEHFAGVVQPPTRLSVRAPPSLTVIPPSPGVHQSFGSSASPKSGALPSPMVDTPATIRAPNNWIMGERHSADSGRSTPPLTEDSYASSITSTGSEDSLFNHPGGSIGTVVSTSRSTDAMGWNDPQEGIRSSGENARLTSPTTLRMRRRGFNFVGVSPSTSPASSPGLAPGVPLQAGIDLSNARPLTMVGSEAWPFPSLMESSPTGTVLRSPSPHPIYSQHAAAHSADFTSMRSDTPLQFSSGPAARNSGDDDEALRSEYHFYRPSLESEKDVEVITLARPSSSIGMFGEDDIRSTGDITWAPEWPLSRRNNDVWPDESSVVLLRVDTRKGKMDEEDRWIEVSLPEIIVPLREMRAAPLKGWR